MSVLRRLKSISLHWQIVIGLIAGVLYAFVASANGLGAFTADFIAPWGRIFVSLLQLIAIPLVLFSIVGGIASLGSPAQLGKMGVRTLTYYLATSVLAIVLGLGIAWLIAPGKWMDHDLLLENRISYELWAKGENVAFADQHCFSCDSSMALIVTEVGGRMFQGGEGETGEISPALSDRGPLSFIEDWVPSNIFQALGDNRNMLKIIFFALVMGMAVLYVPNQKTASLLSVVTGLNEVFIKMVEGVMRLAPFFVFALMASVISQQAGDNPARVWELFKGLGGYSLSVLIGLGIIAFVIYPLFVMFFVSGVSYRSFIKAISPAQLLAFSTSSSAATLPVTMECAEQNLKVDKRVVSFVMPIGSTVNMDGTSLYQAVAVIFLAQMHHISLGWDAILTIVFTTMMASIGSAAIPGAGVVMLMVVLTSVGLNPAWIAIILPVDRILDMFRTVINVTGDVMVSLLVAKSIEKSPLENQ
jgi:Na+/H+-dicarboxylate symporter